MECNADSISIKRHVSSLFKLSPPKVGPHVPFHYGEGINADADTQLLPETIYRPPFSPEPDRDLAASPISANRSPINGPEHFSPISPEPAQHPTFGPDPSTQEQKPLMSSIGEVVSPIDERVGSDQQHFRGPTPSPGPEHSILRAMTVSPAPGGSKSKWPKFRTRKPSIGETKSLSSSTLEAQKPDEICLKNLTNAPKPGSKGKGVKDINVCLSQNSTHALFWTPPTIQVWDIGMSPVAPITITPTDGSCLLAAVTKTYLAYMIGSRDQKLSVRL